MGTDQNYSLGGKLLANREGDYESYFREGGGRLQSRVWEGHGKKIFARQLFMQNQGVKKKS